MNTDIRPGDVAHDLTQNSKLYVAAVAAESVAEYREREGFDLADYKAHPLLGVDDDDRVFTCVYLKGEVAEPGQTYDFPESRLARFPAEEANQDLERVQRAIRRDVLEDVFDVMLAEGNRSHDEAGMLADWLDDHDAFDADLIDEARELAEADRIGVSADAE